MKCPACNNQRGNKRYDETKFSLADIYRCKKCGAVFGSCYLGDSYGIVLPSWHQGDDGETFYYDLECLGSKGLERRHGWASKATRQIVQVG